jgi:hypothetical protein
MEGFLKLKSKYFGALRSVWVVLDGQQLTYYDNLDLEKQIAVGFKGALFVKDATITKFSDVNIKHGIAVKAASKVKFECGDANTCSSWYNALVRATKIHIEEEQRFVAMEKYCSLLNIDPNDTDLSTRMISKAYRKLCLKEHPDKGGNVDKFNQITVAFEALSAILRNIEEINETTTITYEAVIEKAADGSGLGIVVVEDKVRQQLIINSVAPSIIVLGLSEEAEGGILPGDALVGVDVDDCALWTLARARARLGPLRLPPGAQVRLTLERRVPLSVSSDEDAQDEDGVGEEISGGTPLRTTTGSNVSREGGSIAGSADDGDAIPSSGVGCLDILVTETKERSVDTHIPTGSDGHNWTNLNESRISEKADERLPFSALCDGSAVDRGNEPTTVLLRVPSLDCCLLDSGRAMPQAANEVRLETNSVRCVTRYWVRSCR